MTTVRDLTDPYVDTFTPVPPAAEGVCNVCHGAPNPGWATCWSCDRTVGQVSLPIIRIAPITLYEPMGQMHHVLRKYKDGPPELQRRFKPRVAALLGRFLQHHASCIGEWDVLTTVPSSKGRTGTHPLAQAVQMVPDLAVAYSDLLSIGPHPAHHGAASDLGFTVNAPVQGRRVLLVDDTFTSGAEVQSAASALQLAGAAIPAAVVIGRYIDPRFNDASKQLWEQAHARPFRFERCCLCDPPWPDSL
jgi:predicted amidophosphoribosyltransferase